MISGNGSSQYKSLLHLTIQSIRVARALNPKHEQETLQLYNQRYVSSLSDVTNELRPRARSTRSLIGSYILPSRISLPRWDHDGMSRSRAYGLKG